MKKVLIGDLSRQLGQSHDNVIRKCRARNILKQDPELKVYYVHQSDIEKLKIDLRSHRHLAKYPSAYKKKPASEGDSSSSRAGSDV